MPPKKPPRTNKKKTRRDKEDPGNKKYEDLLALTALLDITGSSIPTNDVVCSCSHGCPDWSNTANEPAFQALQILEENFSTLTESDIAIKMAKECGPSFNEDPTLKAMSSSAARILLNKEVLPGNAESAAQKIALIMVILERVEAFRTFDENSGLLSEPLQKYAKARAKLDSRRNITKFFAERIPCHCLDEIKQAAKNDPRTGMCVACLKEAEDATLFNCSACGMAKYCSRECQVGDWSSHRHLCKAWRRSKKEAAVGKSSSAAAASRDGDDSDGDAKPKAK